MERSLALTAAKLRAREANEDLIRQYEQALQDATDAG